MVTIFKRAPSQLSERRIDPWHYQPNFEEQINKIEENVGSLSLEEVIELKRGVAGGATPLGANYLENGRVKFYRTSEVEEMFLRTEDAVFISDEDDEKLKRSRLADGDVLLTITGAKFGKSAVVSSKHLPGNISQHSVRFKPDPKKIDAYFLVAFLNGKTGQITIWREAYGATRPAIDFPSVRSLAVPKVTPLAQKYIGDKVRQAEQLRTWAKLLELRFKKMLSDSYPDAFENKRTGNKYSKAPVDDISYTLNPGAFDEERLRIRLYLKNFGAVPLRKIAKLEGPTSSGYLPDTKYIGLDAISSNSCALSPSTVKDSDVKGTSRLLSEGPVVSKLRPYLNKVSYIPTHLSGAVGSTELLCVKSNGDISDWYLYGILKSDITLEQLKPVASGSTHPRIDQFDLYDVVIPIHDAHQMMGSWLKNAQLAYFAASQLVEAAKTLVESLIEGQLTEQQLIQSQQALEDGDNSLDREILSKLSNGGYAVDGATPIFSDVDELYQLLESAQQQENEE